MQVSRHVGVVHREDVLDETADIPFDRRQPQGQVRRSIQGDGGQRGRSAPVAEQGQRAEQALRTATVAGSAATAAARPAATAAAAAERRRWRRRQEARRRRSEQVQLPAEAVQPGTEGSRHQRPGVPGTIARLLRTEPASGHTGHPRSCLQRVVHRRGRVRPDVLRPGLQDPPGPGVRTVQLHFPVVLRGQVQRVPVPEDDQHVSVDARRPHAFERTRVDQLTSLII